MTSPAARQRTVLITGGTRGIGATIAVRLSCAGYRVFVTSRKKNVLPPGGGITVVPLDITDAGSVDACIQSIIKKVGGIDVLVNNAGYDLYGATEETTLEEIETQIDTNLLGAIRMTRAVLPGMRDRGGGRIVQISSLGGLVGLPMNSAYAASKFGLEGFSESLRLEVLQFGIFITLIEPGPVATDTLETSIVMTSGKLEVYADKCVAMVARMRKDGSSSKVTPGHVADSVLRTLVQDRPPLRVPVGAQAQLVPIMKGLFPQSIFERVMNRLFS